MAQVRCFGRLFLGRLFLGRLFLGRWQRPKSHVIARDDGNLTTHRRGSANLGFQVSILRHRLNRGSRLDHTGCPC